MSPVHAGWAGARDAAAACAAASKAAAEQRERLQGLRSSQPSAGIEADRLRAVAAAAREQIRMTPHSRESERLRSMLASVRSPEQPPVPAATMQEGGVAPWDGLEHECQDSSELEKIYDDDWVVIQYAC
eukprot:CAMPEP_0204607460 /NCGR_PEP_ID=MMETSP0661-20131031/59729_1 /ASSEMBLY_ACC=CAM_ASM_000606 /TAXON_ID=109239 /ORGANISM="Alexandrium margalefi, Strain AMGDE01CS-322" /LENGTH=128 /DNA_ID=CAMNT_0051618875 /DNA_START=64 /DNA_END=447 /DNA_ORIENTATION=-